MQRDQSQCLIQGFPIRQPLLHALTYIQQSAAGMSPESQNSVTIFELPLPLFFLMGCRLKCVKWGLWLTVTKEIFRFLGNRIRQ